MSLVADLSRLLAAGERHRLLALTPMLMAEGPVAARLLLCVNLLSLGRIETAVRELAVLVETVHDDRRAIVVQYLTAARHAAAAETPPPHLQAQHFLEVGALPEHSLGRLCLRAHRFCGDTVDALQRYDAGCWQPGALNGLLDAMALYTPLYVYDQILALGAIVERYMRHEESQYPDYHLVATGGGDVAASIVSLHSLYDVVIRHLLVRGFLHHAAGHAAEAVALLSQLNTLLHREAAPAVRYFQDHTRRLVGMLLVDNTSKHPELSYEGPHLLRTIARASGGMTLPSEYHSGRLCQYFLCCGAWYSRLAFRDATTVRVLDNQTAQRLSRTRVAEMTRKCILAAVLKPADDPSVLLVYHRILWGILMHGGLQLQAMWFFTRARNHAARELGRGPISVSGRFTPPDAGLGPDVLARYANGHEVVDRIYALHTLGDAGSHLIPQVFHQDSQLVFAEELFDEETQCERDFVAVSPDEVRPRTRSRLKVSADTRRRNEQISAELVDLWVTSYRTYRGTVPGELVEASESEWASGSDESHEWSE
ncbi:Uncharacterized protein ABC855_g290 [[Candida] zeylanoides]